jgi:ABC-type transporter Mla maintaining outer membrane lipid asymmetry ATPase subunit MlaF/ABC-type transporter Mla maintaining outer membrane lipid asymmetry permease subunit MlaE
MQSDDAQSQAGAGKGGKRETLLSVRGLRLALPGGRLLFDALSLEVEAGEIVALLGGSGAGKSTLARALFEPRALSAEGFKLTIEETSLASPLGLVPQRGALFDHLDVGGNIRLAHRHRAKTNQGSGENPDGDIVERWLEAVDLPADLKNAPPAELSGGMAQRVAVARTLAGGRRVLFLDEPSVGLDPARVSGLAQLLRQQAARGSGLIVVTHDIGFACNVADRLLLLDGGKLEPLAWDGPTGSDENDSKRATEIEATLRRALAGPTTGAGSGSRKSHMPIWLVFRALLARLFGPFFVPGAVLLAAPAAFTRHIRDLPRVFGRVLANAAIRPLPFYLVVSAVLGYTVLYVISRAMPAGLRADKAVELVGGSYIVALTPPLAAFLFAATSGSAVNAWLGAMGLTKQTVALDALGISRIRYLWVPGFVGLLIAQLFSTTVFAGGMMLGGAVHCLQSGVKDPWALLLGDLLDPKPSRRILRDRALWLIGLYAAGTASEVVYRGTRRKEQSDDVTRAMTSSVIASTLWVVALELFTAVFVFARQ